MNPSSAFRGALFGLAAFGSYAGSDVMVKFLGKGMKMSQVEHASKPDAASILTFYMGKNTPERKDYIMEKLVVPVED